jgi:hypothetical protein
VVSPSECFSYHSQSHGMLPKPPLSWIISFHYWSAYVTVCSEVQIIITGAQGTEHSFTVILQD